MLKIAITGHRELLSEEKVRSSIAASLKFFKEQDSDIIALTSIAAGSDIIFAEEALKQKIPLRIVLPFSLEEYKKDFESSQLIRFEKLIRANDYLTLSPETIASSDDRNIAYLNAGKHIVDQADIVLAVWDGEPSKGKGGTSDIVDYAKLIGKELHIVYAARKKSLYPDESIHFLQNAFDKLDIEAVELKEKKFRRAWIAGIVTGVLAVIFFALGIVTSAEAHSRKFAFACIEIVFLFSSLLLFTKYAKTWKNAFLQKRRDAEYLRTVTWHQEALIPINEFSVQEQKPSDDAIALGARICFIKKEYDSIPNTKRILWSLATNQIEYHQKKRIELFEERLERTEHWLKRVRNFFFIIAIANFILEAMEFLQFGIADDLHFLSYWFIFLLVSLPAIFAALEGVKYFSEWKRNIANSQNMIDKLTRSKQRILDSINDNELIAEAKILRDIFEYENSDWLMWYKQRDTDAKV